MSKKKDRERASRVIFRSGNKISRAAWDKYQRELRETEEAMRLQNIGLVQPGELTKEELWRLRRP